MLLIVGTVRLPADRLESARAMMGEVIEASRAEAGCIEYSFAEDVLDRGLIHITERWKDRAALEEHFKTAHLAEWRAAGPSIGIGERNLRLYEIGEPLPI
jgi:quinol monooxygenase YgiN